MLFRVRFSGLINVFVRQVHGVRQTPSLFAPARLRIAKRRGSRIRLRLHAILNDGFHRKRAGDFSVRFAAHPIGKNKEIQRFDNTEAIFVVRAHAPQIGYAAAYDPHKISPCCLRSEPAPTPVPGNPVLTLADPFRRRKAVTPTDYLFFRLIYRPPSRGYNQTGQFVPLFLPLGSRRVPPSHASVIICARQAVRRSRPASRPFSWPEPKNRCASNWLPPAAPGCPPHRRSASSKS